MFLKSRYYPVNITNKIIYNDPQPREMDCSSSSRKYQNLGTIGLKGARLNKYDCYKAFEVRQNDPERARLTARSVWPGEDKR